MKRIKLPEEWEYFSNGTFKKVRNRKNFAINTIFKREKDEYFQLRKKGIKSIREKIAFRWILRIVAKFRPNDLIIPYYRNRKKVFVEISSIQVKKPNRMVHTITSPQSLKVSIDNHESLIMEVQKDRAASIKRLRENRFPKQSNHKAMLLLKSVAKSYTQLELHQDKLKVKSVNGKDYEICMKTGRVFNSKGYNLCVIASTGYSYPLTDNILAKALVIAFSPDEIHTLN